MLCQISSFNTSYVSVQEHLNNLIKKESTVSIHHMCRFKLLCGQFAVLRVMSFNTSYVSVQEQVRFYGSGGYSVSIHHMCRFKRAYKAF